MNGMQIAWTIILACLPSIDGIVPDRPICGMNKTREVQEPDGWDPLRRLLFEVQANGSKPLSSLTCPDMLTPCDSVYKV